MNPFPLTKPSRRMHRRWLTAGAGLAAAYVAVCMAAIFHPRLDAGKPLHTSWTLTRVGQAAPRFRVTTTDGTVFDSAASRHSRPVLITFFATWCGPCGRELARLEPEVWQKNRDRLDVIAISIDDGDAAIKRFWGQKGFTFPAASDAGGKVFPKFAASAIPRTCLIDAQGRIVYQSLGYTEEEFPRLIKAINAELSRVH